MGLIGHSSAILVYWDGCHWGPFVSGSLHPGNSKEVNLCKRKLSPIPDELHSHNPNAAQHSIQPTPPALRQELLDTVQGELGPVAVIGELNFVNMLPKTRSGKIIRRVLKAVILDRDPGDITTIEDKDSVEEARQAWAQMREEIVAQVSVVTA